jgi:hypothetical protein
LGWGCRFTAFRFLSPTLSNKKGRGAPLAKLAVHHKMRRREYFCF